MANDINNNQLLSIPRACENCPVGKIVRNHCLNYWQMPGKLNNIPEKDTLNSLGKTGKILEKIMPACLWQEETLDLLEELANLSKTKELYRKGRISSTDLIEAKQERVVKIIDLLIGKKLEHIKKSLENID